MFSYFREEELLSVIWTLQEKLQTRIIESYFSTCIVKEQLELRAPTIYYTPFYNLLKKSGKFFLFSFLFLLFSNFQAQQSLFHFVFDRPLLLLLNSLLEDESGRDYTAMMNWINASSSLQLRVLELMTENLLSLSPNLTSVNSLETAMTRYNINEDQRNSEASRCVYFLKLCTRIISYFQDLHPKEGRLKSAKQVEELCLVTWADALLIQKKSLTYSSFLAFLVKLCLDIVLTPQNIKTSTDVYIIQTWALRLLYQITSIWENPLKFESSLIVGLFALVQEVERSPSSTYRSFILSLLQMLEFLLSRLDGTIDLSSEQHYLLSNFVLVGMLNDDPGLSPKWLHAIKKLLPLLLQNLQLLMVNPIQSLCKFVHSFLDQHESMYLKYPDPVKDYACMDVFIAKLKMLSELVSAALLEFTYSPGPKKSNLEANGIIGNVISGVFAAESSGVSIDVNKRLSMLLTMQDALQTLFLSYSWHIRSSYADKTSKVFMNDSSVLKEASLSGLKEFYFCEPLECVETLVQIYLENNVECCQCIWDIFSFLSDSEPQYIVKQLVSSFFAREGIASYAGPSSLTAKITQLDILCCMSDFVSRVEGENTSKIFTEISKFVREIISSSNSFKNYLLVCLRMLLEVAKNVNTYCESRQQKDFIDLMGKTLSSVLFHAGKSSDPNLTVDFLAYHKAAADTFEVAKTQKKTSSVYLFVKYLDPSLLDFFCSEFVPKITELSKEEDKLVAWATSIVNVFITPLVKARTFPESLTTYHLDLLLVLSKHPFLSKSWRRDFWEIFNDNSLFRFDIDQLRKLSPVIYTALYQEISRLNDLITKSDLGVTTLFTSRDTQLGARQSNICRITILMLSSPRDFFLPSLPPLIDLVKRLITSDPEGVLKKDLFLFIRALALRTSSKHLLPLWPIVVSELLIIFKSYCMPNVAISKETLLDACRLLDFLTALKLEEFALHEWVVMLSPLDAVYWSGKTSRKSLVQKVSERLQEQASEKDDKSSVESEHSILTSTTRTPSLGIYTTDAQLRNFLNRISIDAYEESYSFSTIDIQSFENSIYREVLQRFSNAPLSPFSSIKAPSSLAGSSN